MERLNAECVEVEKKLTHALKALTVKTSSRGLARLGSQASVTILSLWSQQQFEDWTKKINWIRDQVMMTVTMCLL